jgi:transcription-repair coupling factor (superfamily II helicase)
MVATLSTQHSALTTLTGIPKSAEGLALAQLLATKKTILHIAVNDREMERLAAALAFFAPEVEVLQFPAWDAMPYDRASPNAGIMAERMRVLSALLVASTIPRVVLTTANAATQKLPPKEMLRNITLTLSSGQDFPRDALVKFLLKQGYRRSGKAMEPGEFALRGGILDLVAPGMTHGLRLDFFGDTIETIKPYDPFTQITQGSLSSVSLTPVSEVLLNDDTLTRFRERYRTTFGAMTKDDPLYETLSQGAHYPGMEHWLPLFYEHTATLFEYCPDALVTQGAETKSAMEERWESIRDYYEARVNTDNKKNSFAAGAVYHPLPPDDMFLLEAGWEVKLHERENVVFSPLSSAQKTFTPVLPFAKGQPPFEQLRERAANSGKTALLACFSQGSRERLQTLLAEHEFHAVRIESWRESKSVSGKAIGLAVLPLETGFETENVLILSEQDILGERITRAKKPKKKSDVFLLEAANFAEGELVVHKEHGIGRFEGLVTLTVTGAAHDCLKLIYEGGDKLFLPVENIEMVTRFGLEEDGAKLDKLGGASWQSRKAKLKEKILLSAEALLKTAAERTVKTGAVLETETGSYDDFCARFPYMETEDQARAISDVLEDLHKGRPMDRLICGDVGFGKTEVALRAAFVAVSGANKMQAALICPTTLLARQHYSNFKKRFDGFPVEIRQLSRIVPARQHAETRTQLKEGKVDIIIGTHALLAKTVQFKNLGLLIVDEEQHFGVAQKEKLKELKSDIHVLTLSATPIPRTLQMALTGVRDLSLITTPPVDRLAIRSFVMPFDPVVVREAITREMHRGGKTFVVTPRIKHIGEVKAQLAEIVPEAKVAVAHGQMAPSELDTVMNDFYDGKYDVLLATAIIESGLDIESANTMVIHNAHLLGLSQLYQLRGRVGRGKLRAYAYFLLPHYKELTKNATRRLEVMQTLDSLGAGFTLASHDMDIRGFGNLVGEEQSGHIKEVGIELYQQMLEEAVASLKNNVILSEAKNLGKDPSAHVPQDDNKDWSPQINLGLPVLIPEHYVDDLQLRLGLYRRAASMNNEDEINTFAAELVDRFGAMPPETETLIATLSLKLLCKQASIERLDAGPKGAVITFRNNVFANPEMLLTHIHKNPRRLKARPDQKLVFTHEWKQGEDVIAVLKKLISEILVLANARDN